MATNNDFPKHDLGLAKPVRARGKMIDRSDDEIDEMTSAEAMAALAEDAANDFEEKAPQRFKTILESKKRNEN